MQQQRCYIIMESRTNLLYLCLLLILSSSSNLLSTTAQSFCSRAGAHKKCPLPATADSIDISKYAGTWYEIGATAGFKLGDESGLVCSRAKYSAVAQTKKDGANISVLNSAIRVLDSGSSLAVREISTAAQSVCYKALDICSSFESGSRIKEALNRMNSEANNLSSGHQKEASQLKSYAQDIGSSTSEVEAKLDAISSAISKLQKVDGELSQRNGSMQENLNLMQELVNETRTSAANAEGWTKHIRSKAGDLFKLSARLVTKGELSSALEITEAATWIGAESELILAKILQIQLSLDGVLAAQKMMTPNQAAKESQFEITGFATQNKSSSAGKLQVKLKGMPAAAPYWILALEGNSTSGYGAALVYSCIETGLDLNQGLFLLSRKPSLSQTTVDKFMKLAASFGIPLDCSDPFIYSVQRDGNCGLKP